MTLVMQFKHAVLLHVMADMLRAEEEHTCKLSGKRWSQVHLHQCVRAAVVKHTWARTPDRSYHALQACAVLTQDPLLHSLLAWQTMVRAPCKIYLSQEWTANACSQYHTRALLRAPGCNLAAACHMSCIHKEEF